MGNALAKITKLRRRMKYMFDEFEGKTPWVMILGLDEAGKTTLLYKNKLKHTVYAVPPRGVNIEQLTPRRGTTLQIYDVAGDKLTRHLWREWFHNTEAIVYVVDSTNQERIDEAKFELHDLLRSRRLKKKVPIVVVANKQDMDGALSVDVVSGELGLGDIKNREWSILGASAETGAGVSAIFLQVVDKVLSYRQQKKDAANGVIRSDVTGRDSKTDTSNGLDASSADNEGNARINKSNDAGPSLFDNIMKKSDNSNNNSVNGDGDTGSEGQHGHGDTVTLPVEPDTSNKGQQGHGDTVTLPVEPNHSRTYNEDDNERDLSDAMV